MEMYDSIRVLGNGTFGTVHLCQTKHTKQKIVVKAINIKLSPEALVAAKNEVTILKTLNHPNIIQYHDNYITNGILYIVMEYATSGTLLDYIYRSKPTKIPAQTVMNLFCQMLMGLNHIHEKKIIHRDMKCENIFLTGIKNDVIKIGDFGISKLLKNNKNAETLIGTCNYVAPEVCDGKPYNMKSDIWSLGCILYEMCAMEKLFNGTISNVILSIASGRRKRIPTEFYGVQLQEIIEMMLQLDPNARPDTAKLMALPDIFPSLYVLGTNLGSLDGTEICPKLME